VANGLDNDALEQCFSTSGPRPSGGPQNSFGGPPGFSYFIKNQVLRQRFHKNYKKPYQLQKHLETAKGLK